MRLYAAVLTGLLFVYGCGHFITRTTAKRNNTNVSASIIANATVVPTLEIDTGNSFLFVYDSFTGFHGRPHSFSGKKIFLQVDSLGVFKKGKSFRIPTTQFSVYSYSSYYRCFVCPIDSIRGTITVVDTSSNAITLALDLTSKKGLPLLTDKVTFIHNKDFFKTFFEEYNGDYDNLRIALKEPLKVKKLKLFHYKHTYGLDSLPESIGEMQNLEELDLSLLDLKKLPDSFKYLTKLKKLNLGYNDFEAFPSQIFALENLEELNLELSLIKHIPDDIRKLTKLKVLILDDNYFEGFPVAVTHLANLEELSITSSNISFLPDEIANLQGLKRVNLSSFWSYKHKNTISDISNLAKLPNLQSLDLEWNKVAQVPEEFCELKNLQKLNLLNNPLIAFPETLNSCNPIDTLLLDATVNDEK